MTITLENLSYRYSRRSNWALEDISAVIEPGVHLLLGKNGAGKTTLLHVIDGLRFPTSGNCRIDGGETRLRLPSITSHVYYSGLDTQLGATTLADLAKAHARFYPGFSTDRLRDLLSRFGLTIVDRLDRLSTGQRQKAITAYALSLDAKITLLDEPASGMDIDSKDVLARIIAECSAPDKTIIISTHNFNDVQNLCDGLIILSRSRLSLAMTTDEINRRIAFVATKSRPENAFYSELQGYDWHSIVDADCELADFAADIDIRLLYKALHENDSNLLLNHLNNPS